jgi:hypothetical protein
MQSEVLLRTPRRGNVKGSKSDKSLRCWHDSQAFAGKGGWWEATCGLASREFFSDASCDGGDGLAGMDTNEELVRNEPTSVSAAILLDKQAIEIYRQHSACVLIVLLALVRRNAWRLVQSR